MLYSLQISFIYTLLVNSYQYKQVFVTTRHGLRSPLTSWYNSTNSYNCPNEKYQSIGDKFPDVNVTINIVKDLYNTLYNSTCFTGELMQEGVDQQKLNGQILKQMYGEAQIQKIRSTKLDRTQISVLSAYTQLLDENQIIHTGSTDFDPIVRPSNCSFDLDNRQLIIDNTFTQDQMDILEQLREQTQNYDFTYETFCDAYRVNNILGYQTNASEEDLQLMCYMLDQTYYQTSWNKSQINHDMTQKINVGPFCNEIIQLLDENITNDTIYMFSGHDVSLSPISAYFVELDEQYKTQPDFASMLILEVDYQTNTVKGYYKGSINENVAQQVQLKACNDLECTIDNFYQYMKVIQVKDYNELVDLCNQEIQTE